MDVHKRYGKMSSEDVLIFTYLVYNVAINKQKILFMGLTDDSSSFDISMSKTFSFMSAKRGRLANA